MRITLSDVASALREAGHMVQHTTFAQSQVGLVVITGPIGSNGPVFDVLLSCGETEIESGDYVYVSDHWFDVMGETPVLATTPLHIALEVSTLAHKYPNV